MPDLNSVLNGQQPFYNHDSNSHASKVNRGYLKNNENGTITPFQYNPENLQYSRSINYADIAAPCICYPLTQFTGGSVREFTVELFFYDRPYSGLINKKMIEIGRFLTPEYNVKGYKRPPSMTFVMGYFIRKCVLSSLDINIEMFDEQGNPEIARFTMTLRQVGVVM